MLKKLTFPILIISIIIQLLVPVGMIAYTRSTENEILEKGKEFSMEIEIWHIQDTSVHFEPRYFHPLYDWHWGEYASIEMGENGYATFSEWSDEPKGEDYFHRPSNNTYVFTMYEMKKEHRGYCYLPETPTPGIITFKLYEGRAVVLGIFVGDKPIEEWVKNPV